MPRILFVKFSRSEAKEFYTAKATASDKVLRVESMTQTIHIVAAAVLLKYLSGKYDTYSVPLVILEVIGLFIAIYIVVSFVLRFERTQARKRLEQEV